MQRGKVYYNIKSHLQELLKQRCRMRRECSNGLFQQQQINMWIFNDLSGSTSRRSELRKITEIYCTFASYNVKLIAYQGIHGKAMSNLQSSSLHCQKLSSSTICMVRYTSLHGRVKLQIRFYDSLNI